MNFSKLQERIILDMYAEKKDLLDAPPSRKVTKEMKDAEYDKILLAVNATDSSYKRPMTGIDRSYRKIEEPEVTIEKQSCCRGEGAKENGWWTIRKAANSSRRAVGRTFF